jgi:hypothetical protein
MVANELTDTSFFVPCVLVKAYRADLLDRRIEEDHLMTASHPSASLWNWLE